MKKLFTVISEKIHNHITDKFLEMGTKASGAQSAMQRIEKNTKDLRDQLDNYNSGDEANPEKN